MVETGLVPGRARPNARNDLQALQLCNRTVLGNSRRKHEGDCFPNRWFVSGIRRIAGYILPGRQLKIGKFPGRL